MKRRAGSARTRTAQPGGKPTRLGYSPFTPGAGGDDDTGPSPMPNPSTSHAAQCAGLVQVQRVRLVPTLGEVFFF